jgi:hypothetical protein
MTKVDAVTQEHTEIAHSAYLDCLKACEAFKGVFLPELEQKADQVWWKTTFESHSEELAQRIQKYILETNMTGEGCLVIEEATVAPKRIHWRGHRQKVYQLVAWGLHGDTPTKRNVVRHLCNNNHCINPEHLKIGTQAQNLRDQRLNRIKDWPHQ